MAQEKEKLDDLKAHIRSILLPFQKGCFMAQFRQEFKLLIAEKIPFKEFGFRSEIDFLFSMPDVVRITPHRSTGDYHLQGIPDAKSIHIARMVCKQKPARLKPPKSTRFSRFYESYSVPPRFNGPPQVSRRPTSSYNYSSSSSRPPQAYENSSRTFQSSNNLSRQYKSNDSLSNQYKSNDSIARPAAKPEVADPKPGADAKAAANEPKLSPAEEFLCLVKYYRNGIPLSEILYEYEQMFDKPFDLESYGFTSVDECIDEIEDLKIVYKDNEAWAVQKNFVPQSEQSANNLDISVSSSGVADLEKYGASSMSHSSIYSTSNNTRNSDAIIPASVISKLMQVASKFPLGIWAADFPKKYKEVTNAELDLKSLGYKSLADLIDDVKDIFVAKTYSGNKAQYKIFPVAAETSGSPSPNDNIGPNTGNIMIKKVILDIRKILEGYSEGIKLQEFLHVYSINCRESLHVNDLGFRDLETFLTSIMERVPLRIENLNGVKSIHLFKLSDGNIELPYKAPQVIDQEAIPAGAVFPDFKYKTLTLNRKYLPNASNESSNYIPVFVSNVVNPAHLYIQPQQDNSTEELAVLGNKLDDFYKGPESNMYAMKDIHIKVGAACAALWPSDQHWYRAQILALPSMDSVRVLYIDYGTKETIRKSLLRYLRKDLSRQPIQALKCCLSFLRPPNKEEFWNIATKKRLLNMCSDIPLMAKIEEVKPDGVYSIVLCDTNGEKDVFINDVLPLEGLAEYVSDTPVASSIQCQSPEPFQNVAPKPANVMPTNFYSLSPLEALQAQYFLNAFAATAPSFANDENFIKLFQKVSVLCPSVLSPQPNANFSFNRNFTTPATCMPTSGLNSFNNINSGSAFASASFHQETNPLYGSPLSLQTDGLFSVNEGLQSPPIRAPTPTDVISIAKSAGLTPSVENKNSDGDLFEDDDDDQFEAFCQNYKPETKSARFVKRANLCDGYKIHVINYNSLPYASSGDISSLIWNNKVPDYLYKKLQIKDVDINSVSVSEDGNDQLFHQLEKYNVKGVQKTSGFKAAILLYPLKEIIKILNIFGHPSVSLRTKLREEIHSFNPNDPLWREFSAADAIDLNEHNNMVGKTDEEKIERLCLFDLMAMIEGINAKRRRMLNNFGDPESNKDNVNEISKLETIQEKVSKRIEEIKEICKRFS